MTQPYYRTEYQKAKDFADAREYEEYVAGVLGPNVITRFDATDDLDIWKPGMYIDIKEKGQRYTDRWVGRTDWPEEWCFILDELSVRRALKHYPEAFFLVRDRITTRLYLLPIWEVVCAERVRVNRAGKGKWLIDLRHFRQLATEADIVPMAHQLLAETAWSRSECLTQLEVPQV